ncbi:HSP20-like chaperone [Gonapodya prolifera JEL478]|uniref:HSP20-like chaperone n=1 Tax=Gonapodya prolifera (strain JEL478) TaxID=1344416 RepID=A0A138ZZT1_GONPJ|nr:HSP20-like chaperone [Gonapodya prolifera JEL478]|eukprot:KXS10011.1 HSP20-like chaperone [Gonapodya prolifera JEL478]
MVYPEVLWAQNATELYVTVNVQDVPHPTVKLTDSVLSWEGGNKDKTYQAEMTLFKEVDPNSSKQSITDRNSFFVIKKATEGWWPRLTKDKAHYIKTDFTRWKSEDDEEDVTAAAGGNPFDMDFSQFSNMGGMGGPGGMAGDLPPDDDEMDSDNEDDAKADGEDLPPLEAAETRAH